MRHVVLAGMILFLWGCRCGAPTAPPATPVPAKRADADSLRQRALVLWEARQAENWDAVLAFELPERRAAIDPVQYREWQQKNQPFVIRSFELGRVQAADDLGWVETRYQSNIRQFPTLPSREATRWEKWQAFEGDWYPIPTQLQDNYPDAPALRNLSEEPPLSRRVEAACRARMAGDWAALHALLTPEQRELTRVEAFAAEGEKFQCVGCEVQWVQVTGDLGQVRIMYRMKNRDPSLTKLPPEEALLVERWKRVDGEWFLAQGAIPK